MSSWTERAALLARDGLQTALRLVPWPTEPGLRELGSPGPESPVIVTGTIVRINRAAATRQQRTGIGAKWVMIPC